jgi:hypothetical protein
MCNQDGHKPQRIGHLHCRQEEEEEEAEVAEKL